ncbi:MAG: hypothetical protein ACLTS6_21870 [Anaerobutyricum sp.]
MNSNYGFSNWESSLFYITCFPKMMITNLLTVTKIIPNAIYTKMQAKTFSNKPIINIRTAITDIPTPIVLHFLAPAFSADLGQEVSLASHLGQFQFFIFTRQKLAIFHILACKMLMQQKFCWNNCEHHNSQL